MKKRSSRFYLAMGLASLLVSVFMISIFAGVMPDRDRAVRSGRAALAETLAITASTLVSAGEVAALKDALEFVRQRNEDVLSIGLRDAKGELILNVANHAGLWQATEAKGSSDHVEVPIHQNERRWGTLEVMFRPLGTDGILGFFNDSRTRLVMFVCTLAFIGFYLYLRRMLRHLDPSRAIPDRVRAALDTLAEGLLVLDPRGYIVLANQAFAKVVGGEAEDLIGRTAGALAWCSRHGVPARPEELPWLPAMREGIPQRNQIVYLANAGGSRRTFRVNCTPVLGEGSKDTPVLVSLDDVTELEEKETQLRAAKDDADAASRAKSDFLANMSHEIRTPMNAILGFTELLKRGYTREVDARKHLNTISSSGQHLLELINDILDLSKIEAGHMEVERIRCSPAEVLREVVKVLGVRAAEKGVALELRYDGALPEFVNTDPARLRQIVTNLVGNALKFTERGGVTVIPRLVSRGRGAVFQIDVADTGIGIPKEKLGTIFESFSQADTSINRRFGGTGLGLTISRRLAEALGGEITVASTPGKGSVFTVSFDPGPLEGIRIVPPEELAQARDELAREEKPRWRLPRKPILVVDDGAENRELARLVLEDAGAIVLEAENGQVALDIVAREPVDYVLMDMQMPVMDGVTATRTLRARGFTAPIIALTANLMKGFDQELAANGFTAYIGKPIDIDQLLEDAATRLGGALGPVEAPAPALAPVEQKAPAPVEQKPPAPVEIAHAAPQPIVSRLANHPRLARVAVRFVEQLPVRIAAMRKACDAGDMNELGTLAHWLKGTGGTVGFDDFFAPARELEERAKAGDLEGAAAALATVQDLGSRVVAPGVPAAGTTVA